MFSKVAAIALVVLLAFPLGMRLAGERTAETPLGEIDFSLTFDPVGAVEFYVPLADWGVKVDLFDAPVLLKADPKAIDRESLLLLADGQADILKESRDDLSKEVLFLTVQNAVAIMALTAVFAFLISSFFSVPQRRFLKAALLSSASLLALFFVVGAITYSPEKIEEPTFFARGSELEQLIAVIDREMDAKEGSYQSNFDRLLSGVSNLLLSNQEASLDTRQALLFSDLHTNALALGPLGDFARDKPVFFVGDFAHQGNDAETEFLSDRVADLSETVIAVSGNHDSALLMRSLAKEGVIVLGEKGKLKPNGSWQKGDAFVYGLRVAGYSDPLEWKGVDPADAERIFSFKSQDPFEREKDRLIRWWQEREIKPDVLLLHQEKLALALADHLRDFDEKLTILTGHTHSPKLSRSGSVYTVNAGSAGAGGLFGVGSEKGEIAGIHFEGSMPRFIDFISVDPIKGSAQAERVSVKEDLCSNSCFYEPSWGEVIRSGGP